MNRRVRRVRLSPRQPQTELVHPQRPAEFARRRLDLGQQFQRQVKRPPQGEFFPVLLILCRFGLCFLPPLFFSAPGGPRLGDWVKRDPFGAKVYLNPAAPLLIACRHPQPEHTGQQYQRQDHQQQNPSYHGCPSSRFRPDSGSGGSSSREDRPKLRRNTGVVR